MKEENISEIVIARCGIHSRPAATLARNLKLSGGNVTIKINDKMARADSIIDILLLGIKTGDQVELHFEGANRELFLRESESVLKKIAP